MRSGGECAIDEEGDQRRKQVLKRKLNSLEEKGKLLDRLVTTLQETDRTSAAQIVNLIRSQASIEEIRAFIDDIMERPKLEKTPELIDACGGVKEWHDAHKRSMRSKPNPGQLSDTVLFRVPAYPWTKVSNDDNFVSHLISLWFTWVHPFLNWIDRDLFIRDMQSKDLKSEFCSPFLVNIILADACVSWAWMQSANQTSFYLMNVMTHRHTRTTLRPLPWPHKHGLVGCISTKRQSASSTWRKES